MDELAPELIYNIFSFLTYPEVYSLRSVSHQFQMMAEYHIYQQIKSTFQHISIKLGDSGSKSSKQCLELVPTEFDFRNGIIEFKPVNKSTLSLGDCSRQQWSAYYRLLKIHFSGWFSNSAASSNNKLLKKLSPQDQALFLYHHQYNSSIEKVYELPSWYDDKSTDRYLGDQGFILNMAYHQPQTHIVFEEHPPMTTLPTSYYSYHSIASNSPMPSAPIMEVKWVRVTLEWILSGMMNMKQDQIYKENFVQLDKMLAKEGCFKYNPLSEPVLNFVVNQKQELPNELIKYVQSHTHECQTKLARLQHMLEGAGCDSQVVWKYSFAKSYVVGNGSLLSEEDVVRRIQDAEEEWRLKKLRFNKVIGI